MGEEWRAWLRRGRLLAWPPRQLEVAERLVSAAWPDVAQLKAGEVQVRLANGAAVLVDVRTAPEFGVSRLAGAVRLTTAKDVTDYVRQDSSQAIELVLLYCAIGVRSSALAAQLVREPNWLPGIAVTNLRGGIFRWQQDGRPLVDDRGPVMAVHPFSWRWAHLARGPKKGQTRRPDPDHDLVDVQRPSSFLAVRPQTLALVSSSNAALQT